MRLLAVAFGIATLVGATGAAFGQESPRPVVILVHGRGQIGQDSAALRREWTLDLDSSLALVGVPPLQGEDVRLAWYADVLDSESDDNCQPSRSESDSLTFGDIARGFVGLLSSLTPPADQHDVRGVLGDVMFLVDPATRCAAQRRVRSAIDAAAREHRPVIVIAFSLGALVTHDYLKGRATDEPVRLRLITVGSPLGIRAARMLVFGDTGLDSLRLPAGVLEWDNVYDPADFFSAPVEGEFAQSDVHDYLTTAIADDPHTFRRYLLDRRTGEALKRALCAFNEGCVPKQRY